MLSNYQMEGCQMIFFAGALRCTTQQVKNSTSDCVHFCPNCLHLKRFGNKTMATILFAQVVKVNLQHHPLDGNFCIQLCTLGIMILSKPFCQTICIHGLKVCQYTIQNITKNDPGKPTLCLHRVIIMKTNDIQY